MAGGGTTESLTKATGGLCTAMAAYKVAAKSAKGLSSKPKAKGKAAAAKPELDGNPEKWIGVPTLEIAAGE